MNFLSLNVGLAVGDNNRRYLEKFLNKFNKQWDVESSYWIDYGCNCRGDLDRSAKNLGKPLDALDKQCRSWKQCIMCSGCNVDDVKYSARMRGGAFQCRNAVGSCERAICECDLQFAKDSGSSANEMVWNSQFWGDDLNTNKVCKKSNGDGSFDGQCCENPMSGLNIYYNAANNCCSDAGEVLPLGTCY